MKPARLLVVLVSLPLVLFGVGCGGEKESELDGVNYEEIEIREGITYVKGSDIPYTGKIFGLYPNGQKFREGNYKDGNPDGIWVYWYENEQKKWEGNWKNGKAEGLWVRWHENGNKSSEGTYKDSKMEGLWVIWHENGNKRKEGNYKDGKKISAKYWNSKGEPVDSFEEARKG